MVNFDFRKSTHEFAMQLIHTLIYLFLLQIVTNLNAQNSLNIDLFGLVNRGDTRYSGSWSYVAPDGSEYALLGAKTGTAVYSIDDPDNIAEVGFVPGPSTNWREITSIGDHAYVVTDVMDSGHSMQVIDLSFLPDSVHLDTTYTSTFTMGHIIQKDIFSDAPYVYVMGTSTTSGVHILDVSDPKNPVEIGLYAPGYYIHDAHIRGDIMFAAAFYNFEMDIVDISDKSNPLLIGKITYDGKNTHSSSLTMDGKYLVMADEADGFPGRIFNVEDFSNPIEVAQYTANDLSLVHNPYIKGDFCYISHNTEGLRILDISDPEVPVEVGYYDTFSGPSGGFSGLWSACPYFPSGKIIGGDRHEGLFVWQFNETKAARIYGTVIDSISGEQLFNVSVEIPEISSSLKTDFAGDFKIGMLEGNYTINVNNPGYIPKELTISLLEGENMAIEIPIVPEGFTNVNDKDFAISELKVFPNPNKGEFSIDLKGKSNGSSIYVYSEAGQFIYSQKINGQGVQSIDRLFSSGKYYLEVQNDEGNIIARTSVVVF